MCYNSTKEGSILEKKYIESSLAFLIKCIVVTVSLFGIGYVGKIYYDYKQAELHKVQTKNSSFIPTFDAKIKDLECLATNIYYEAGNQSFEGKVAVAQVTLNRLNDGRFGKSVCEVVYAKGLISGRMVCQFSWVCENKRRILNTQSPQYIESMQVAKKVYLENFKLSALTNSLFFHADYVAPGWRKERIMKIGRHIFYKG